MLRTQPWEALMSKADYLDGLREEIVRYREMLEPLESGKMHIGERKYGGQWTDRTQAQIDHLKHTIATLQGIVDRFDGEGAKI
jgi:hypothetical protein